MVFSAVFTAGIQFVFVRLCECSPACIELTYEALQPGDA